LLWPVSWLRWLVGWLKGWTVALAVLFARWLRWLRWLRGLDAKAGCLAAMASGSAGWQVALAYCAG